MYLYKGQVFFSTKLFALLSIILVSSVKLGYFYYVWYLIAPYLIISIAILLPFERFSKYGDFSYGIYVYAFPVQQTLVYFFKSSLSVSTFILYTFVVTLCVAILSWHLIEKPALSLKRRLEAPAREKEIPAEGIPLLAKTGER